MSATRIPLCVDLDGTLSRSDTLYECLLGVLKQAPLALFRLPQWLLGGRAHLKQQLAQRAVLDAAALTYVAAFVASLGTLVYYLMMLTGNRGEEH